MLAFIMQIFVEFLNFEGGTEEIPSSYKRVSQVIEHLQRKYPGRYPGLRLKYYDQELKDDQLLKDLLEENESILELGALEKMTEDDKLRACISTNCRIVFKQKGNKTPQFLYPNDTPFEFKSSFFRRNESFVVFKDAEEREDGEQVWIGYRYVLQVDGNLLDVKVKNEGVFKRTKDHGWSKMEPVGEPVRALEGDFFMPVSDHTWFGQPLSVYIKNKTGNKILAISGGSKRFKKLNLDPVSEGDDRAQQFKLRKVNRGYALGLTTEQNLDGNRNKVYITDMYMIPGGGRIKLIEIETTARQGYRVTLIKANDERLNPLQKVETKTFREADKDFWRNTLTKGLIALGSAVVAGAVGEGVEEAVGEIFGTGNAGEVSMDSGDVSTDNGDVLMDTGDGCDDSLEIGADRDDQQGMPAPVPDGEDDPINDCNENL